MLFRFFLSTILFIAILISLGCRHDTNVSKQSELDENRISMLMEQALDEFDKGNFQKSESLYKKINGKITPQTDTILQIKLLFNESELLKIRAKYKHAVTNYYKALKMAQATADTNRMALAYYNISTVYFYLNKIPTADYFIKKAVTLYNQEKNQEQLAKCQVLNASICREKNDIVGAHQNLRKVILYAEPKKDNRLLSIALNNNGNLFSLENKNDSAIQYYIRACEIGKLMKDENGLAIRLGNIGEIYLRKNDLNNAKMYIDSSMTIAKRLNAKETELINLERQTDYFKRKNNYPKAFETSQEMLRLKTEILSSHSTSLLDQARENFQDELRYVNAKNKIEVLKKEHLADEKDLSLSRLKFYLVLIAVLLSFVATFIFFKKQKEIVRNRNRINQLEKQRLADELKFKQKELVTFSLSLSERENVIRTVKNTLTELRKGVVPNESLLEELKQLLIGIHADGDVDLHYKIEEINSSFHFKLKTNYPVLTDEDIRLASLLFLGTSSKDISTILKIEVASVNMKRYRLKKKLNLERESDLIQFLKEI